MEAIRGHKSPCMALMSWELHYCFERLKNIHQVRFYLIKHCGLHWVTTWPQMNQPNNIPFWGLKANLNQIQIQSFPPHFMAMRVTKKCISWLIKISLWYHPQHGIWELRVKIPNKMAVFVLTTNKRFWNDTTDSSMCNGTELSEDWWPH